MTKRPADSSLENAALLKLGWRGIQGRQGGAFFGELTRPKFT